MKMLAEIGELKAMSGENGLGLLAYLAANINDSDKVMSLLNDVPYEEIWSILSGCR